MITNLVSDAIASAAAPIAEPIPSAPNAAAPISGEPIAAASILAAAVPVAGPAARSPAAPIAGPAGPHNPAHVVGSIAADAAAIAGPALAHARNTDAAVERPAGLDRLRRPRPRGAVAVAAMVWLIVAAIVAAMAYSLVTDFSAEVGHQHAVQHWTKDQCRSVGLKNGCSAPMDSARAACADIDTCVSRPDPPVETFPVLLGVLSRTADLLSRAASMQRVVAFLLPLLLLTYFL
ncbi:hypothetical protein OC844_008041 [Tilletia horrida]|nr:hypothetical protein OC844_008041 [Tilletia horrida]